MSTAARPVLAVRHFQARAWIPWAVFWTEVAALEASLALGLTVRYLVAPLLTAEIGPSQYIGVAIGILCLPAVHYQLGLYPGYCLGPVERLRRRLLATFAVFSALIAWDSIVQRGTWSRGVLLSTFVFAVLLPPLAETAVRQFLVRRGRWGIPVLILGCGKVGTLVARALRNEPNLGLVPIGFLDDNPRNWGEFVEDVPVIGPVALAEDFVARAEAVIVALSDLHRRDVAPLLAELAFPRVLVVPNLSGIGTLWVTARDLGGCLGLEVKRNLLLRRNHILKRVMDQTIAFPLFLLSLPLIAVAAAWIKLAHPGPVFFRQRREGRDGKPLDVWKLRTMHSDADRVLEQYLRDRPEERLRWRKFFKLADDPRVLPGIGRFLRRTSLDELPQLWSVLRGEMSLVGPRPFPEYHLEQFSGEFRTLRGRVPPGLTGLWQVAARSDGDLRVQETLDTYYIRNWSPWLDLYILGRTCAAVLLARGAY
jgi:Undecaprenyl-phosphate galactose phosphotransferase WbaP